MDTLHCAYIHVPKTGGHSIDALFSTLGLVTVKCWHATAAETIRLIGGRHYFLFATVRNPWDRLVSEYVWQGSNSAGHIPTPWGNKAISFEDFCRSDFSWYPEEERLNGHLSDQAHFIFDENDAPLVDEIIRFEALQAGFDNVCRRLGLPPTPLPRLNSTQHRPYWQYYSGEVAEIVAKRFERDIRLLGYRFRD